MKNLSLVLLFLFSVISVNAQESFKKRYVFKRSKFKKEHLFLISEEKVKGVTVKSYKNKELGRSSRYGRITKRSQSGDTLFIHFWDIAKSKDGPNLHVGSPDTVNINDNGKEFAYVITKEQWEDNPTFIHNYHRFRVPYKYQTITATNIPFRINVDSGNLIGEFTNFNLTYLWVFGRTKIFKKPFIEPRNFHVGIGPFAGLTSLETDEANKTMGLGISYGFNAVFSLSNFNLVGSCGFDTGFKGEAKKNDFWVGFGVGFNLVNLFNPHLEEK